MSLMFSFKTSTCLKCRAGVCLVCLCSYVCVLKIPACAFLCNNLWVGTLKKRCIRFRFFLGSGWLVDTDSLDCKEIIISSQAHFQTCPCPAFLACAAHP